MSTTMKTAGFSLIEILLGIAAGLILVTATALLTGRAFNISREHTEQVRITEDARVQLERMSDAIRDARSLDLTGDNLSSYPSEVWLQSGKDYEIQFYTNLDEDSEIEQVRYFLEGTDLKRGVRDPHDDQSEQVVTVARSLRNVSHARPLFRYYAPGSQAPLTTPVVVTGDVERVEIILLIDVEENQAPGAAEVSTVVTPRASDVVLGSPTPTPTPTFSLPSPSGTGF